MDIRDELVHVDLFDRGLDRYAQSPFPVAGQQENLKDNTMFSSGVPSSFIQDGDTIVRLNVIDGYLQSNGFVSGETGWRIDAEGNVEFESGVFRGDISGSSGTFGNLTINETENAIVVSDGTNDRVLIGYLAGKF